jgi:hypothetical protein
VIRNTKDTASLFATGHKANCFALHSTPMLRHARFQRICTHLIAPIFAQIISDRRSVAAGGKQGSNAAPRNFQRPFIGVRRHINKLFTRKRLP